MKQTIHLIRHGLTEGNVRRLFYGWTDFPLLPEGIEALKELRGENIHPRPGNPIFITSDLIRTEQTMEILYGPQEHIRLPELRELHFGIFENKSYMDLKDTEEYRRWTESKGTISVAEGVETMTEFRRRIGVGMRKVLDIMESEPGREAIVVIHGGVIDQIMAYWFPGEDKGPYGWIPDTGRGYTLLLEDGVVKGYQEI